MDAESFVAFGALRSRPKIFLLLLAAVVLALEETDAAAEEELLEAVAEEEMVAEVTEEDVLRIFWDPSKGQDQCQLNAKNIGLRQPVEISLTAQKDVQSSAMEYHSGFEVGSTMREKSDM